MKRLERPQNSTEIILPSRQGLLDSFLTSGVMDVDSAQLQESPCGRYTEHYAPGFEVVNAAAKVAVIGYTPGRSQANTAWRILRSLPAELPAEQKLMACHSQAAFAGLRSRIDQMAGHCGLLDHLAVDSLLNSRLAALTSRFVFPVFDRGKNYSVRQALLRTSWLLELAGLHLREFVSACPLLQAVVFLGDGKAARETACYHLQHGDINREVETFILPHPSGANNARIAKFLQARPTVKDLRL